MEATIAITISASSTFFFFISPIPIHARNSFASVYSSPERRVPRTAFGVFHARQGMDALAGGSQGDGGRVLFIQICSQADRIPIYNGAVSSAAGCWAAACAAFAASFFAAIFAACSCLNLFNWRLNSSLNSRVPRTFVPGGNLTPRSCSACIVLPLTFSSNQTSPRNRRPAP